MATQIANKQTLALDQPNFDFPQVGSKISNFFKKLFSALMPKAPTSGPVNEAQIQKEIYKAQASMMLMNLNR